MSETDLVLERTMDAPRHIVWSALTTPEHIKKWWAPRPYQTPDVALDLRPGGRFYNRMTGPDGFEAEGNGCILDVAEGERMVWTSALGPGWRPNDLGPDGCGRLAFTAIITLADAGEGKTLYRALAMHRNPADAETHAGMGFHDGWGTCADQLGEVAAELEG